MRETLFKAKTESGIWIEGDLIHYQSGEVAIIEKPFSKYGYEATEISRRTLVLPDTICQYTGLTDKNGNKIWENDIVDIQHYAENAHKVKWGYGGFYVGINGLLCHYNTVCEVIGNIFDNACIDELLKGEEE